MWCAPWPEANQHAHYAPYTSLAVQHGRYLLLYNGAAPVAKLTPWQDAGHPVPGYFEAYTEWQANLAQPGELARLQQWLLADSFGLVEETWQAKMVAQ